VTRTHPSIGPSRRRTDEPIRGTSPPKLERDSAALCASAILVFTDLFRRAPELEPDMGLGEAYEWGRRTLMHRRAARAWDVTVDRSAAVEALLARARAMQGDAVIDTIETLPAELLAVLDRRRSMLPNVGRHRRRWSDDPAHGPSAKSPGRGRPSA